LLSYLPEMRGKTQMIEEGMELHNLKIWLRDERRPINRVYLAPENVELPFKTINGYTEVIVIESKGYSLIVFE